MYARAPRNCDIKVYRMYVQRCFNFYIQIMLEIVYIYMIVCFALKQFSREVIETVSIYYLFVPIKFETWPIYIKLFARSNRFPFVPKENEWNNTRRRALLERRRDIVRACARNPLRCSYLSLSFSLYLSVPKVEKFWKRNGEESY